MVLPRLVVRCLSALCLLSLTRIDVASGARESSTAILDGILKYDRCVIQSTFSYIYSGSYPPRTMDELKRLCNAQTEGIKCIKEKTKGGLPILRRGLLLYAQARQKHHKKICSNFQSDTSKKFVEAAKCSMEKRFAQFEATDKRFVSQLKTIYRKNYNDSTIELKHLCCAFWNAKQGVQQNIGQECRSHAAVIEEMQQSVYPNELNLICDEDDKLAKVCPNLEPIQLGESTAASEQIIAGASSVAIGLYLVATLGEAQQGASGAA